jgi:hypothetical protein
MNPAHALVEVIVPRVACDRILWGSFSSWRFGLVQILYQA